MDSINLRVEIGRFVGVDSSAKHFWIVFVVVRESYFVLRGALKPVGAISRIVVRIHSSRSNNSSNIICNAQNIKCMQQRQRQQRRQFKTFSLTQKSFSILVVTLSVRLCSWALSTCLRSFVRRLIFRVTRFGKFLPLWEIFQGLWLLLEGLFSFWQKF